MAASVAADNLPPAIPSAVYYSVYDAEALKRDLEAVSTDTVADLARVSAELRAMTTAEPVKCCEDVLQRVETLWKRSYVDPDTVAPDESCASLPKGTGYAGGFGDSNRALVLQKIVILKEQCLTEAMRLLAESLVKICSISGPEGLGHQARVRDQMQATDFPAVIQYFCMNESFMDMAARKDVYVALVRLLSTMASSKTLLTLLTTPLNREDRRSALAERVARMSEAAKAYLKLQKTLQPEDELEDVKFASQVADLSTLLRSRRSLASSRDGTSLRTSSDAVGNLRASAEAVAPPASPEKGAEYCRRMRELQFGTAKLDYRSHHYAGNILRDNVAPRSAKMMRLVQEIGSLASALPLNEHSSVFVRVDEDRLDVMKAMIVGPQGTPYENGLFEFDIYFPPEYPSVPPMVNLCTTGGNTVRFNPNLYECGKVCLSLLGTWSGEPWNPAVSTLLQVLVSLQALVLVPEPFYNEPGDEASYGTPEGEQSSRQYNDVLYPNTVLWAMTEHVRNPPAAFKDVVAAHFELKKEAIAAQLLRWRELVGDASHWNMFEDNAVSLREVLGLPAIERPPRRIEQQVPPAVAESWDQPPVEGSWDQVPAAEWAPANSPSVAPVVPFAPSEWTPPMLGEEYDAELQEVMNLGSLLDDEEPAVVPTASAPAPAPTPAAAPLPVPDDGQDEMNLGSLLGEDEAPATADQPHLTIQCLIL